MPADAGFFFVVLYIFQMTATPDSSNVPSRISSDDLQKLMDSAVKDAKEKATKVEGPYDGLTEAEVKALASETLDKLSEVCDSPMLHKALCLSVLNRMIYWHKTVAKTELEDSNPESAGCWMRDAGKFQAMANILCSISLDRDDFLVD